MTHSVGRYKILVFCCNDLKFDGKAQDFVYCIEAFQHAIWTMKKPVINNINKSMKCDNYYVLNERCIDFTYFSFYYSVLNCCV